MLHEVAAGADARLEERLVVVTSPSAPSCGTREVAVVADLVVAEHEVVAALHEVARQAGADARLEVSGSRWR